MTTNSLGEGGVHPVPWGKVVGKVMGEVMGLVDSATTSGQL